MVSFFNLIRSHVTVREGVDGLRWKLKRRGFFDSISLMGLFEVGFPWKGIWVIKAPQKISFFVWTTT